MLGGDDQRQGVIKLRSQGWRQCPRCANLIERNADGCTYIKCRCADPPLPFITRPYTASEFLMREVPLSPVAAYSRDLAANLRPGLETVSPMREPDRAKRRRVHVHQVPRPVHLIITMI